MYTGDNFRGNGHLLCMFSFISFAAFVRAGAVCWNCGSQWRKQHQYLAVLLMGGSYLALVLRYVSYFFYFLG